jgi:hypothetical protein
MRVGTIVIKYLDQKIRIVPSLYSLREAKRVRNWLNKVIAMKEIKEKK